MRHHAPICAMLAAVLAMSGAAVASEGGSGTAAIGVVPFQNNSGTSGAVPVVMLKIRSHLAERGFRVVGNGRVEEFLRRHRIREHHAVSRAHAAELARILGARYLLLGTIDTLHDNGGPEIGLTARIVDPHEGGAVWSNSVNPKRLSPRPDCSRSRCDGL